jgi:hypothetical protein
MRPLTLAFGFLILGCGGASQRIALQNSAGKADGASNVIATIYKTNTSWFDVQCNEWFSCDVTATAEPTNPHAGPIVQMNRQKTAADYPAFVADVTWINPDGSMIPDNLGFITQAQNKVPDASCNDFAGDGTPLCYLKRPNLLGLSPTAHVSVGLKLVDSFPANSLDFLVSASWH